MLVTWQIVEAGKLLDCACLDHLVIGQGRWVSMRKRAELHVLALPTLTTYDQGVEMFYQYIEPQIVVSTAFTQAFGYGATPLDDAIRATVQWYQAEQPAQTQTA